MVRSAASPIFAVEHTVQSFTKTINCNSAALSRWKMLGAHQAIEIYRHKVVSKLNCQADQTSIQDQASFLRIQREYLSKYYGVTVRAIQDIWNRRSWAYATSHLWHQELNDPCQDRNSQRQINAAAVISV